MCSVAWQISGKAKDYKILKNYQMNANPILQALNSKGLPTFVRYCICLVPSCISIQVGWKNEVVNKKPFFWDYLHSILNGHMTVVTIIAILKIFVTQLKVKKKRSQIVELNKKVGHFRIWKMMPIVNNLAMIYSD